MGTLTFEVHICSGSQIIVPRGIDEALSVRWQRSALSTLPCLTVRLPRRRSDPDPCALRGDAPPSVVTNTNAWLLCSCSELPPTDIRRHQTRSEALHLEARLGRCTSLHGTCGRLQRQHVSRAEGGGPQTRHLAIEQQHNQSGTCLPLRPDGTQAGPIALMST